MIVKITIKPFTIYNIRNNEPQVRFNEPVSVLRGNFLVDRRNFDLIARKRS